MALTHSLRSRAELKKITLSLGAMSRISMLLPGRYCPGRVRRVHAGLPRGSGGQGASPNEDRKPSLAPATAPSPEPLPQAAEERYHQEPVDDRSPDKLFERRWALALLDQVLARLEQEFHETGKADLFERLHAFLVANQGETTYAETAAELGMTAAAVQKAVERMRHRYYALFRQEIAHTVANPAEVQDEMRHLCAVIAG